MRVCLTVRSLDPTRMTPTDRLARLEAAAWVDAGHTVCLLADDLDDAEQPAGVERRAIDHTILEVGLQAYPTHDVRRAMGIYQTARAWHAEAPFDAIVTDLAGGEAYFALRAKRTEGRFDGCALLVRASPTDRIRRLANGDHRLTFPQLHADLLEQEVLELADGLFAETDQLLRVLDDERVSREAQPRRLVAPLVGGATPDPEIERSDAVLFAGPFERRLGVMEFAEAAAALLDADPTRTVRLVGWDTDTGPFGRSALDAVKRTLGDRSIEIVEDAARDVVFDAIAAAGVLCVPGDAPEVADAARFAAAIGVPVLCTPETGTARLVRSGHPGRIVSQDPGAWRDALLELEPETAAEESAPSLVDTLVPMIESTPGAISTTSEATSTVVTVIVTVYNLGAFLREAVDSIDAQTHPSVETIFIDDGSTDPETIELLDVLESEGRRVVRKPNGGLSSARNAGVELAQTDWVLFFDADDVLDPAWIQQAVGAISRDPDLDWVSPLVRYFETDPEAPTGGWVPYGADATNRDLLPALNIGGAGAGSMIRTQAVRDVGGYDEEWTTYEDWDLWCALAGAGRRGTVVPSFGLRYRIRPDSMYRTEAVSRHEHLKSRLLEKHPGLITTRTLRAQFAEAARHQSQVAGAESSAERMAAARTRLQARVERLESQARAQAERAERAIDAADQLRLVEQSLRTQYEQLRARLAQVEADRDQQRESAVGAHERAAELARRLAASRDALEKLRETVTSAQSYREVLEKSVAGLREQVESRGARFEEVRERFEQQRTYSASLQARIDTLIASHADQIGALKTSHANELDSRIASHAEEVGSLDACIQALREELSQTIDDRDSLAQRLHEAQIEMAALPGIVVQDLLAGNVRYRVADRVNGALKAVGVQKPIKAVGRLISPTDRADA